MSKRHTSIIVSLSQESYNKFMIAYMKMNYGILIGEELDGRKHTDILGLILAAALLCILAGKQTTGLPVRTTADSFHAFEGIEEGFGVMSGIDAGNCLDKNREVLTENRLGQAFPLPEIPKVSRPDNLEEGMASVTEPVILPEEGAAVPDNGTAALEVPEASYDDDTKEPEEEVLCKGFLLDASGKITGCQNVLVIDGVLCLPSDIRCTGVAAGALASLGTEIYEIYIPANIAAIEEGAFDGLPELIFIEVHPDNPVYESREGILCRK